jgi:hypothetical protein
MKGKFAVLAVIVCFILTFGAFSTAKADTILFPVIAVNQPNVTTIVSVFNDPGHTSSYLHYIYRNKASLVGSTPNHAAYCGSQGFTRNTFDSDIVSFDTSGVFNGGNALFNDPNTYGGAFGMSSTGAQRAYLLVTNSDAGGTRVDVGDNQALGGEAIVMDIASGAAWGYRAANDISREDYSFTEAGTRTVMSGWGKSCKWFSFAPPNEWTTKFFVTPIGNNMNSSNIASTIFLAGTSTDGIFTRGGTFLSFTNSLDLTCTAGVSLVDMIDSTALSVVQNTGGWSWMCEFAVNPVIVYKLEYVVNDPTYGGTNNNGYLLSIGDYAW